MTNEICGALEVDVEQRGERSRSIAMHTELSSAMSGE